MPHAAIAWGGNLPETPSAVDAALTALENSAGRLLRSSPRVSSTPMGVDAGSVFLNGAVLLETPLAPLQLLEELLRIEAALGRTRSRKWEPRVVDLDLLLFDQTIHTGPLLTLPHPAMWYRRFVLSPLVAIAPDVRHPVTRSTVAELRKRLDRRPVILEVASELIPEECSLEDLIPQSSQADVLKLQLAAHPHVNPNDVFARLVPADDGHGETETLPTPRPWTIELTLAQGSPPEAARNVLQQHITDILTAVRG